MVTQSWLGRWMVVVGVASAITTRLQGGAEDVIPLPRQIKRTDGVLVLSADRPLHVVLSEGRRPAWTIGVSQLATDLKALGVPVKRGRAEGAPALKVGCPGTDPPLAKGWRKFLITPDPKWGPEGYRLQITPKCILIAGNGPAGCFYGLQTLRQMLEPGADGKGARLECVDLCDWPAMKWRGTMFGLQSPDEHARLASYKMNLLNWEVNQTPDYRTIPEFAGGTPMPHYREVAASARRHFINMTMETQSFGHVRWMLEKFPKLRAMPDNTHVLRPLHEPTYALIGRIHAELCPLYDTPIYHAGCDEAWGIEEWAEKQGLDCDEVIGKHIQRLADLLARHGKRTMIWGDYLLKHRRAIKWMRPKDYLVCDWHYAPRKAYPSVDFFVKNGFETLVSPAVVPARPIFPDYARQIPNIRVFIQDGAKRGAVGLLNTNWPVSPMPTECYWYGWACGAEYAWNPTGRSQEAFDRVFFRKVYGLSAEQGRDLFAKLARLGVYHQLERRANQAPEGMLRDLVRTGWQAVAPRLRTAQASQLLAAQEALDKARHAGGPRHAAALGQFQAILDRLEPIPGYLQACRTLGTKIADATEPPGGDQPAPARVRLNDVRRQCQQWLELLRSAPGLSRGKDASALAARILKAIGAPGPSTERQVRATLDVLGLKPEPIAKTVRIQPGPHFRFESEPSKTRPPHARPEGWCHFPRRDAAASWTFDIRHAGRYRILALLRHSAGIWQNDQFVKGGRNAAYVGRYGWKLDGESVKEQWIGQEVNPDADEAFQWAVLADKDLDAGTHVLYAYVTGINHAIVAEIVFTQDPSFVPETKRNDIRLK